MKGGHAWTTIGWNNIKSRWKRDKSNVSRISPSLFFTGKVSLPEPLPWKTREPDIYDWEYKWDQRNLHFNRTSGKKRSYTRKHAPVVDTSLLFCACGQLRGVLLRPKSVTELDLTCSISPRACWLGPESFQTPACKKRIKFGCRLQDYKIFCVTALD